MSSWATRTHASLRPLAAADAPARHARGYSQTQWLWPRSVTIEKFICVHAIEARRCPRRGPISALTAADPALAWGAAFSRCACPCRRQRCRPALAKKRPPCVPPRLRALLGTEVGRGMAERNPSERKASIKRVRGIVQSRRAGQAPLRIGNILANIAWRSVRTDKKI